MKKGLASIISILSLSFVSAQFSLSDALSNIDSSLVVLSSVFIIAFLLFSFSLSKFFKGQKQMNTIISAILAFLVVFGINSTGFDISGLFFDLGLSEDAFLTLIPLVLLAGIIFLYVKLPKGKKKNLFYILGGFLVAVGLLIFREAAEILVLGVILIVFGFIAVPILSFIRNSFGRGKTVRAGNSAEMNDH